jgi:hypothetical protein
VVCSFLTTRPWITASTQLPNLQVNRICYVFPGNNVPEICQEILLCFLHHHYHTCVLLNTVFIRVNKFHIPKKYFYSIKFIIFFSSISQSFSVFHQPRTERWSDYLLVLTSHSSNVFATGAHICGETFYWICLINANIFLNPPTQRKYCNFFHSLQIHVFVILLQKFGTMSNDGSTSIFFF